jgi:hypothetical protein
MATLLESLGLTPQHYQNIAEMQKDPASYGGTQAGYAIKSAEDLVSQSKNPVATFMGQTFGSPIYDYGQALGKYSDKGYQGEFSLTPRGAVDFGKNLLSVGEEFLAQKPITMMAGRTLGGIEGLGDWAYENLEPATQFGDWTGGGIYNLIHGTDDDETGTIAFDPNNPQVNLAGLPAIPAFLKAYFKNKALGEVGFQVFGKGLAKIAIQKKIQAAEAAAKEAAAQAPGGGQWVGGAPAYTYQGQGGGEYTDPHTGSRDYHDPYDPGGGEKEGGLIRKAQGGIVNLLYGGFI